MIYSVECKHCGNVTSHDTAKTSGEVFLPHACLKCNKAHGMRVRKASRTSVPDIPEGPDFTQGRIGIPDCMENLKYLKHGDYDFFVEDNGDTIILRRI